MLARIVIAVVLVLMSFEAPAKATNLCFDQKKLDEETNSYLKLCPAESNTFLLMRCFYTKMAVLKKIQDKFRFDFVKMKEYYISRLKNNELKTKIEKELTACEWKNSKFTPRIFATEGGYCGCVLRHITEICYEKA
uniref:Uncharacterized protein n=1 Tax=Strigamia maritima TaxID=126957 RepID=T1J9M1_STRMM